MQNPVTEPAQTGKAYDVIIVGAGPAGISAARTIARLGFSALVLERLSDVGQTAHPCNALLAPVPGLLSGRRLLGDLFYPQLDLLIPLSLVAGYPREHRLVAPSGRQVTAPLTRGDSSPVAAIDRAGLLRLMSDQAARAGAEFHCGAEVTGLLFEDGRVAGVKTDFGDIRAPLTMVAEGASRRLSRLAGLYDGHRPERYATILTRELLAPAVRRQHLGQITTYGRRYTSARAGFGSVMMALPGRAAVTFTVLSNGSHELAEKPARTYLDEYVKYDPRVSELLRGAETVQEAAWTVALGSGPNHVVADGLMTFGDAATPAGHMGMLPAMYLGRQAALVAAEALDLDDVSASVLGAYESIYHTHVRPALQIERELLIGLAEASDAEIERLTRVLPSLPLAAPFFSGWQGLPWETARWLARHYPNGEHQTALLQRILDRDPGRETAVFPAGLWLQPSEPGPVLLRR